jgi:hypothetical protein
VKRPRTSGPLKRPTKARKPADVRTDYKAAASVLCNWFDLKAAVPRAKALELFDSAVDGLAQLGRRVIRAPRRRR